MPTKKLDSQPNKQQGRELPPGVKLLRILEGHEGVVNSVVFDPVGHTLASGGGDGIVRLWDVASGNLLRTLEGHKGTIFSVAYDPKGRTLASGGDDNTVKLWDATGGTLLHILEGHSGGIRNVAFDPEGRTLASGGFGKAVNLWEVARGKLIQTFEGHRSVVYSVAFDPTGRTLATGSLDYTAKLWEVAGGKLLWTLAGYKNFVVSVAFDPTGRMLATGSYDNTVRLWEVVSGKLLRTLEGHTGRVDTVAFSVDGRLLASKSHDGTLRLWNCETWEMVAVIPELTNPKLWISGLAFHPTLPLLATVGSKIGASGNELSNLVHFWELDFDVLLGKSSEAKPAVKAVHHTTAKIVLVGDHSVGKSGLGWRLAHGEFKEQHSTHGQQFWVLPQLGKLRDDGTECEAILWDLAGQPDYRLIHALFLDDVDLALVLFDSSNISDPLHGVEFWLKQLKVEQVARESESNNKRAGCSTILVGAQADRGTPTLTAEDLETFCRQRGISGYLSTSALTGLGLEALTGRMKELVAWEDKPATVTTVSFKRIKDYVLKLKESLEGQPVIVSPPKLRQQLEQTDATWQFTDAEMMTAVGHLENYGYVKRLRTSKGEERILLAPEILNNLAASFILEARRNPRGLGSLEEKRLMEGGYSFQELEKLSQNERDILLDSAALLFLEHNICFRETDPLNQHSYLVFPELINLKKPASEDEQQTEDGAAYTVSGSVENVYASLVVLLGYTQTFTRTDQWRNQARYEVGDSLICGFRQDDERDGELNFVLYFGTNVIEPVRTLFQGLFENFLGRRNLTVFRYEPLLCPQCNQPLDLSVVRTKLREGKAFTFCNDCGGKLALPKAHEPIQLTQQQRAEVETQRRVADLRTRFEQAVFRVNAYVKEQGISVPECFISYAWGDRKQERWVEKNLATDLQKAGLKVLLDKWENSRIGSNIMRFVERIEECDQIIVVGTPQYRQKAKNVASEKGSVVAAEWDLAGIRMLTTEAHKQTVLPVLLAGDEAEAFPALLRGRVYADFRDERAYFITAFDLILDIYGIAPNDTAVADLRESLRESKMR